MKKLLALLLAASTTMAVAGETYINANIGVNTSWSSLGLNANAGYMFNKYVGAEGGFTYSPGYNYTWGPGYSYSSDYWMLDGAVKGVLPLSNIVSLYGKLGLAFNNYSGTWNSCNVPGCVGPSYVGSNVNLFLGGGVKFDLTRTWSLHVEDYASLGANPNFFMFGGQYSF